MRPLSIMSCWRSEEDGVAELAEPCAGGLAEDAKEVGGRGGRGHAHGAVEAWVVVDGFGDGFRPVFHHLALCPFHFCMAAISLAP